MKKLRYFIFGFAIISLSFILMTDTIYIAGGKISFTSDAPLEIIKASSVKLVGALNTKDKEFIFRVNMKSFEGFNSALQREHFNENYIETHKFPKASFKGKIIEDIDFKKSGIYKIRAKGKFSIHGVEQNRIIKCNLEISKNQIKVNSNFSVFLDEHNIKIPNIVNQKIAEEIMVKMEATLKPRK